MKEAEFLGSIPRTAQQSVHYPTRPSDCYANPKYNIEIWEGIPHTQVVFGEGLVSSFFYISNLVHTQVSPFGDDVANRWALSKIMHTHKSIWVCFAIFVLGGFLYGCSSSTPTSTPTPMFTPSVEQMDKSFFTGFPCAAPCWQGLEVGKSSERDVVSVIPKLTFISQETIQTYHGSMPNIDHSASAPGILVEANCANSGQQCLSLAVVDDVLVRIVVGLNYEIRPDEVIGYLGIPDYVGYANLGSERVICEVYLVWKSRRLVLATKFENVDGAEKYCYIVRGEGKIPASLLLSEARYLSEAELKAYLQTISGEFFEFSGFLTE